MRQTFYEQEVEDINSIHKIENHLVRRLIVMPLTDAFKPNQADFMHGKIQYGDKCSMPASIGRVIFDKRYEVPWIFELVPVRSVDSQFAPQRLQKPAEPAEVDEKLAVKVNAQKTVQKAYVSPLDFRSPENYIYLPKWLMDDLQLKPNDLVDVSLVRIKLASLVTFQPLTLDWDVLIESGRDPKTLLEHEINKYSSLTAGTTISINIDGTEYSLYVKETRAEGNVAVQGVRVQDADVRTDIDRSVLDRLIMEKKKQDATSKENSSATSTKTKRSRHSNAK